MNSIKILSIFGTLFVGSLLADLEQPPNIVIILLDDAGFGDFHPFGDPPYETPHVEKLAAEGMLLHNFYIPAALCSASRAALLTGTVPGRNGVFGAHGPNGKGLDPRFMTMAEVFRKTGYATAHFGKWHVGDRPATRPMARGFDEHAGLMYSNDMWDLNPSSKGKWKNIPLQYWENGSVKIEEVTPDDQTQLTTWSTEYSIDFINRKREQPFFLYLAHSMPHVPLYCSDKFLGKSGAGLYGDVMMELDWSVGEVMRAIKSAGIEENTIVIFTSDNGPWSDYGNHAGVTPFRGLKNTSFNGGIRCPAIIKFPREIKGGSELNEIISSIDLLPTLGHLSNSALPLNEIDGKNVWPIISGKDIETQAHEFYVISGGKQVQAIISGDGQWKLILPHTHKTIVEPGRDGIRGRAKRLGIELTLFNLKDDPYETENLIDQYPEIASKLKAYADRHILQFYQ